MEDSDYILYLQESIQYGLRITSVGYCASGNHFGHGSNQAVTNRCRETVLLHATLSHGLVGRNSGKNQACHPFWYRRNGKRGIGRPTIADYVGDVPRTGGLQRQHQGLYQHQRSLEEQERYHRQLQLSLSPSILPSPAAIQDQPPDVQPYPTDQTFQSQSMNTTDNDETTALSQETILKAHVQICSIL